MLLKPLIALLLLSVGVAEEVVLQAPMTTIMSGWSPTAGLVLQAVVEVPDDAPTDLGVGAWISDRHGRWFQQALPGTLTP